MDFYCPCGFHIAAADSQAGQTVLCPSCRRPLIVPGPPAAPPAPAAPYTPPPNAGLLPARIWNHDEPMRSAERVGSVIGGVLLMCLFFLPLGKGPDGTLVFLWKLAPDMPKDIWFIIVWTFSFGVLAFMGGLFASGLPLGVLLAGGTIATFVLMILTASDVPPALRGSVWAPILVGLILMIFIASLRLRRMYTGSKTFRILVGVASGVAFLCCLLPIEGTIALQAVLRNIELAPFAALLFATILAAILGLISLAPMQGGAVSGLTSFAEACLYIGILIVPCWIIFPVLALQPPAEIVAAVIAVTGHIFARAFIILLFGVSALVLLIGVGPAAHEAHALRAQGTDPGP